MEYVILIIVPLLGAAFASFFSVLVTRKDKSTTNLESRSACDHCGKQLSWYELIPLLSFLIQRGKCRHCKKRIDTKIFLAEVLGVLLYGVLAIGSFTQFQSGESQLQSLAMFLIHFSILTPLFYLAIYDLFWMAIPASIAGYLTIWAIVINAGVLVLRYVVASPLEHIGIGGLDNLLMGIVFGGFFYLLVKITKEKGIGEGDIFIATLIGLSVGWPETIAAFYIMLFSATSVGLIFAAIKRKFRGLRVPLVPFLTLGYIVAVFFGEQIFNLLFFAL